tara:strand:+ start:292 stop:894 length:603 start_codon:yes stop_codon:yes gene_type:complete
MENIYKNNLIILKELQENESIYYCENKIIKEDRYLGNIRCGNNLDKILGIINISFLHYYNLILISDIDEEIKNLLIGSIKGINNFKIYNKNNNINIDKIEKIIKLFESYIENLENNQYVKSRENIKTIQDNISLIEKEIQIEPEDIEEENHTEEKIDINIEDPEPETTKPGFLTDLILGITNTVSSIIFSIYNHIFVYKL